MLLLRPTRADADGLPRRGKASSKLGVRTDGPMADIKVWSGRVRPRTVAFP